MRLTADLINASLSYLNPLKERELDLRGHRIPQIENLGVAGPQDAIDLTDNDIQVLGNFPLTPRLRSLLLAHNRIAAIQPGLADALPNLTNLTLASNQLSELGDLDPLARLGRLTHLVLLENPVTKREHYRYWVVWRCPTVRFLDFQKIMSTKSRKFDVVTGVGGRRAAGGAAGGSDGTSRLSRIKLTDAERKRLQERIKKASSLEEIARLEKELSEGRLPTGIYAEGDSMEE
ncbi:small nuclear ribonucleoprotein a [Grosmannia clavigera kw1407]|uniref:U2 small nuclear ribonucleoprotein A' n=1 Tax=Grosmannia clavigera (strain kw1407 / UAMH 11150) TaxID=655863 RepID=F0XGD0_GROCL|nr:small nuclear ribonucleoprotein a [Grosmannia clavigera kw1407]EFX02898.1 small nuclear ribonucleoprotein a [Grosmannia clavigera kw1407]